MIFQNLIFNKNVWEKVYNAFKNNKIPNAYIFFGIDGIGKEAHAIELAALLNCKRITDMGNACGDCRSCIRIKSFQHEEIHYIRPLPVSKNKGSSKELIIDSKTLEELNDFYKKKIENPYHKIELKNANTIPINAIRDIKKKLYYTKSDENWSIVVISEAEKLCTKKAEAANSLLKILEEPPDRTLFILLTSKINLLTSTILSRCQKHFFSKLDKSTLEKFVLNKDFQNNVDQGVFELSHGSISDFTDILKDDRVENLENLIEYFYSNEMNDIEKFINTMSEINTKDKKIFSKYLNHLKISTKDLYGLSKNSSNRFLEYKFLNEKYNNIIISYPESNWEKIIDLLDECNRDLLNNVNFTLSLYSLMINIQYCLKGHWNKTIKPELIKGI
jgi:DNA polymerase-3 subunit delta'